MQGIFNRTEVLDERLTPSVGRNPLDKENIFCEPISISASYFSSRLSLSSG